MTASPALAFDPATHVYRVGTEQLLSVTQVIRLSGLIDTTYFTEIGRFRGKAVHMATEFADQNDLDEADLEKVDNFQPGELLSYLNGWRKFKRDFQFEAETIEQPMYHPLWKYAGTPDRTGTALIRNKRRKALPDLKLGAHEAAYALQLAGYAHLQERPSDWVRLKVKLLPNDYKVWEFPLRELSRDFDSFMACLRVARLKAEFGIAH